MTAIQTSYWANQEKIRSNRANEANQSRSIAEMEKHNRATEEQARNELKWKKTTDINRGIGKTLSLGVDAVGIGISAKKAGLI